MQEMVVVKDGKQMRRGYTTGSCATAAAKAACMMLLSNSIIDQVALQTPSGANLSLDIHNILWQQNKVICSVTKDAGDDPDVTHGAEIYASVTKTAQGIHLDGGKGVGRVTKPGLACTVGQAAINPVPRQMMMVELTALAERFNYSGGFDVVISVPTGGELAGHTFNPRLGIVGGISILGTTGIVEPMSEDALVDTIKVLIDGKAQESKTLFICPGNYGQDFAKNQLGLDLDQAIKCSNYIGQTLDYAVYKQVEKILFIGHAGKLVKIAGGIMNTHSRMADCRAEILTAHAALAGATKQQVEQLMQTVTTDQAIDQLEQWGLSQIVWQSILQKIQVQIDHRTQRKILVEIIVYTNKAGIVAMTDHAIELAKQIGRENI